MKQNRVFYPPETDHVTAAPALLALEDGTLFYGVSQGALGVAVGEVVFNTAMTGYQEILTDPSYAQQIVTFTYPHIGNTGTNDQDWESEKVWASGLIIRDMPPLASNWRMQQHLTDYLHSNRIIAISDIDTRHLTALLREKGAQKGCIMTAESLDAERALQAARAFKGLEHADLAKDVCTQKIYTWQEGSWDAETAGYRTPDSQTLKHHVVVYDFGVKRNILRYLVDHGCRLTVVPAQTTAQTVLDLNPEGIFLSNGPGDPAACTYAIEAIKTLLQHDIPLLGICLGHQLLGLACGARTLKMKFGHHGANHPVQDLHTKAVMISSQNHGFALEHASLPPCLKPTHVSLFDGSLQGIQHTQKKAFSFQGHPEGSPGPHDVNVLFERFVESMF